MARWIVHAADDCLDFFYYAYLSVIIAECALQNDGATQQNEFERRLVALLDVWADIGYWARHVLLIPKASAYG